MNRSWLRWSLSLALTLAVLSWVPLHAEAPAAAPDGGASQCILKKGDRVAIVGDSITEQKIYSRMMEDYLTACLPDLDLWVVQLGWGGETAPGFLGRMDQDLLSLKPTVVTTCYGMNDGGYRAYADDIGKRYEDAMRKLVDKAKAAGAIVIAGSPGAVDTKYFRGAGAEVYNDNLAHLRDIAHKLATGEQMYFADVHTPLIDAMKQAKAAYGDDYSVCGRDGVHPTSNGHLVMAYSFLKAMGIDGQIGTFTVDMNGSAKATDGHKILSAAGGKVEIESARYPFCFFGDAKSADGTRSILPYVPFNQTLNRLVLVVDNLKSDSAKVTWGDASKTFTKDQLAKGVNLAAEFLDNPFCGPFQKLDQAVGAKQNYETMMIKNTFHTLAGLRGTLNDDESTAAIKVLFDRLAVKHNELGKAVRATLVPVKHTLVIEAQ